MNKFAHYSLAGKGGVAYPLASIYRGHVVLWLTGYFTAPLSLFYCHCSCSPMR